MYALMILIWQHRKMKMIISNRNNILIQGAKNNSTSQRQCSLKIMPIGRGNGQMTHPSQIKYERHFAAHGL